MDEVMTAADASSRYRSVTSPPTILPSNIPLLSAFLAFSLAQFLKLFTTWFKEKRWDTRRMLGSGGMPSSHSATVTALATAIGLQEGTGAPTFAVALVLACVVMYDATGVRLHAGRQAELLNQIVCELPPEHPVSNIRPLRDSLGHTPLQVVAGALLGCVLAFLLRMHDSRCLWVECKVQHAMCLSDRIGGSVELTMLLVKLHRNRSLGAFLSGCVVLLGAVKLSTSCLWGLPDNFGRRIFDIGDFCQVAAVVWNRKIDGWPMSRIWLEFKLLKDPIKKLNSTHYDDITAKVENARNALDKAQSDSPTVENMMQEKRLSETLT
ncbi:unnamed protein product [Dovyalis caffra]|uniref:Acid phosphatase/vanadium-dependent haloperoxidase-related protein n=1 Tax=Dovyalis caffra TaxID=77055 RepID=A0AAV1SGI8_9ROSI|nr:unnamed protein product [Dovyalis caffra]